MLDIITLNHIMQNRQKLMIFEQENDQKPHFGPFLALIGPFSGAANFFSALRKQLGVRYHYSQSYYAKSPKTNDFRAGK